MHRVDGWFRVDKSLVETQELDRIREGLTIPAYEAAQAKRMGIKYKGPPTEAVFEETEEELLLPRAAGMQWWMVRRSLPASMSLDTGLKDRTVLARVGAWEDMPAMNPRFAEQAEAVEGCLLQLKSLPDCSSTLVAGCGSGKTNLALEVARRLQQRTLVLVHKEFLRDQWLERAAEFLPGLPVGICQGDRVSWEEPLVIAMIQSLVGKREYPPEFYQAFGLVVSDEAHRLGAVKWRGAIVQFPAAHRLLLTATPERADGRHVVFQAHCGRHNHTMIRQGIKARVHQINTGVEVSESRYVMHWTPGKKPNMSKLITILSKITERTARVVTAAERAVRAGRRVLVLSDRLEQLDEILEALRGRLPPDTTLGKYVGGMKVEAREKSAQADVVLGTFAMVQEGLDIPDLSVLIMATPKGNVTQSVGRILREADGKRESVVVDLVDENIGICQGLAAKRRKLYKKQGHTLAP